jgi:hypothetical protein
MPNRQVNSGVEGVEKGGHCLRFLLLAPRMNSSGQALEGVRSGRAGPSYAKASEGRQECLRC